MSKTAKILTAIAALIAASTPVIIKLLDKPSGPAPIIIEQRIQGGGNVSKTIKVKPRRR